MPRIPDHVLGCAVYFYKSVHDARHGSDFGGSGFLVHIPSIHEDWVHLYAVTNKHVILGGACTLRLNTFDGSKDVIETNLDDWMYDSDDVAVTSLEVGNNIKWWSIGIELFITQETIKEYNVGVGDEAYLVGRLINAQGHQRNTPAVRFGTVSMMADSNEPIEHPDGGRQESFLVDCRSVSGFSGSPVFVSTTQTLVKRTISAEEGAPSSTTYIPGTFGPWLLGIDWGHLPLWRPVFEQDCKTKTSYFVDANTGIASIVPAWRIRELLFDEDLVKQRKRDDEQTAKRKEDAAIS